MVVLGIDYGTKRIGLALAQDNEKPHRLAVVAHQDWRHHLEKAVADHGVTQVVIGLPRNLDGDDTPQTMRVRVFAQEVEEALHLPVRLQDEADTSNQARKRLANAGHKMLEIERQLDAEAAVIIVEDYLSDH
jgi:putative Holliday junction resolvase